MRSMLLALTLLVIFPSVSLAQIDVRENFFGCESTEEEAIKKCMIIESCGHLLVQCAVNPVSCSALAECLASVDFTKPSHDCRLRGIEASRACFEEHNPHVFPNTFDDRRGRR